MIRLKKRKGLKSLTIVSCKIIKKGERGEERGAKGGKVSKEKNNEVRRETPSVCGNKRVPLLSGRLNMNGTKQNEGFETLRVLAILLATVA